MCLHTFLLILRMCLLSLRLSLTLLIIVMGLAKQAKCVHVHISYMHSSSPPAPSCSSHVAGRQLGDIEVGTGDTTARNRNTLGDNRRLTTVFRRKRERRKRQTEARNADGIKGGKDRDKISRE